MAGDRRASALLADRGSDWPVVELAGGYDRWHDLAQQALESLDSASRAAVFGDNAIRVYLRGQRGVQSRRTRKIAAAIMAMKNTSVHAGIESPRKIQPASAHSPLPVKTLVKTSASGIDSIM